jgi:hypothetical protein
MRSCQHAWRLEQRWDPGVGCNVRLRNKRPEDPSCIPASDLPLLCSDRGTRLRGGGGDGDSGGDGGSLPLRYWAKYLDLLDSKPLVTRMVSGFLIGTFGDILSQYMAGGKRASCFYPPPCCHLHANDRRPYAPPVDRLIYPCAAVTFSRLDIKRLLVFSAWGGFGFTPIAYNWYNIIESTVPV